MRVLILSFYYPPDIGPGSLRAKSIVDALSVAGNQTLQIDVLTTLPNRYQSMQMSAAMEEKLGPVSITRFRLPDHKNGMTDQAYAFLQYALAVNERLRVGHWDLVVATSSRLMTASLGAWVAKKTGAMLYLDIRDLFTDTMADVLASSPFRVLLPIFRMLELWTFRAADQMNVVSAGFLSHVKKVAPSLSPTVYTNGIDPVFVEKDFQKTVGIKRPLVVYAGNMGEGQGLHRIVPDVASMIPEVQFKLLGDGGMRQVLETRTANFALSNVDILNPISRIALMEEYRQADILFLHLNSFKAFHKVLPSKIFEYAATEKPILAGVSGYAADFLRDHVLGVEVFEPCNSDAMKASLLRLLKGPRVIDRTEFCSHYLRQNIMEKMAVDIESLASTESG